MFKFFKSGFHVNHLARLRSIWRISGILYLKQEEIDDVVDPFSTTEYVMDLD